MQENIIFIIALLNVIENCDNDKEMVHFILIINAALRDMLLEIRKAVDENTGEHFYVLVNLVLLFFYQTLQIRTVLCVSIIYLLPFSTNLSY